MNVLNKNNSDIRESQTGREYSHTQELLNNLQTFTSFVGR